MGSIVKIPSVDIEKALGKATFLNLTNNPEEFSSTKIVDRDDIEIGIGDFKSDYVVEPHFHHGLLEFHYMISGWAFFKDVESLEEFEFKKGDFFVVDSHTKYACKIKSGTRMLYIRIKSNELKYELESDTNISKWLGEAIKKKRFDYYHDDNAPFPNSIVPESCVAIIQGNEILLLKRADNEKWTMPGGSMKCGESMVDCALRQVYEQTGYMIQITDVIGTYTDPSVRSEYSDGEVRQEFAVVYKARLSGGKFSLNEDFIDYRWVKLDKVDFLDMTSADSLKLEDARIYFTTGIRTMA